MIYISGSNVKKTPSAFTKKTKDCPLSFRQSMHSPRLVLASTSSYRKSLLQRLGLAFDAAAPGVDETPLPGEDARQTSERLSVAKAWAVAADHPDALIIGSDQVALLNGEQLGKPLAHDRAVRQLRAMRGRCVVFYTALTLLNARTGRTQTKVAENQVCFRDYTDEEIESYLRREQPYDCAGSAKSEGMGIVLISRIGGDDPNALVGLPLIELVTMLKNEGVQLP
jgi:septum formation protein